MGSEVPTGKAWEEEGQREGPGGGGNGGGGGRKRDVESWCRRGVPGRERGGEGAESQGGIGGQKKGGGDIVAEERLGGSGEEGCRSWCRRGILRKERGKVGGSFAQGSQLFGLPRKDRLERGKNTSKCVS